LGAGGVSRPLFPVRNERAGDDKPVIAAHMQFLLRGGTIDNPGVFPRDNPHTGRIYRFQVHLGLPAGTILSGATRDHLRKKLISFFRIVRQPVV
jgi:hypothetical protein